MMTGTFKDPDVDPKTLTMVQSIFEDEEPVYPWTVLEVAEANGIDKEEARKALRKLRMSNYVVPTVELKGKLELAEKYPVSEIEH